MFTFTPLQKLIEQTADDHAVDFRASYGGRGSMGRGCIGLTGTMREIQTVIASVHADISDELFMLTMAAETEEDLEEVAKAAVLAGKLHRDLGRADHDSMANDIVVYWPSLRPLEGQVDIPGGSDRDSDV